MPKPDPTPVFPLGGAPRDAPTLDGALRHLRALVTSSPALVREDRPYDPVSVCFYCGATLTRVAHREDCAWWRARVYLVAHAWMEEPEDGDDA